MKIISKPTNQKYRDGWDLVYDHEKLSRNEAMRETIRDMISELKLSKNAMRSLRRMAKRWDDHTNTNLKKNSTKKR